MYMKTSMIYLMGDEGRGSGIKARKLLYLFLGNSINTTLLSHSDTENT